MLYIRCGCTIFLGWLHHILIPQPTCQALLIHAQVQLISHSRMDFTSFLDHLSNIPLLLHSVVLWSHFSTLISPSRSPKRDTRVSHLMSIDADLLLEKVYPESLHDVIRSDSVEVKNDKVGGRNSGRGVTPDTFSV